VPKATTQLTTKWLERNGWNVDVVERWVSIPGGMRPGYHRDLYGCIDVVALKVGQMGLLGVQTTSYSHRWDRRSKLLAEDSMRLWVMSGCKLWVVGWRPKGHEDRANPNVYEVTLEDFKK